MEREPLGINIHTHAHAFRTQNQPQDVLHSSRHVIEGSHDTHFSLKPYIIHSLGVLGLFNLAVFVIFTITPVLFISLDANSPDLSHIHLAVCKQSMIGYSLISRYWIFLRTNTLLLTKGQKHQKGLHDAVCILAKRLYLLR